MSYDHTLQMSLKPNYNFTTDNYLFTRIILLKFYVRKRPKSKNTLKIRTTTNIHPFSRKMLSLMTLVTPVLVMMFYCLYNNLHCCERVVHSLFFCQPPTVKSMVYLHQNERNGGSIQYV